MSTRVSVIVPCYNQGKFLSETLDSIIAQTYGNWECIVVNDGSIDNTYDVVKKYLDKDARIKYIYQENAGLSAARNTGVLHSSGKYILPLDSDDKIGDRYLELAVEKFENNEELKVVYCRAALFGIRKGEWKLPEFSIETMLGRNCIFCSALYKRTDFDEVGGYNTNMKYGFEDWDFWLSLLESGGEVHQIDEILFFYRIRKRSMARMLDPDKMKYLRRQIWKNHQELYAKNFLDPLESFEYRNLIECRYVAFLDKIFKIIK